MALGLAIPGMRSLPCIVKTARAGYDGKGQWKIDDLKEWMILGEEWRAQGNSKIEWVVEAFVPFVKELSVVVVRGAAHDGGEPQMVCYPVADNLHKNGILRRTLVPADVSPEVAACAQRTACEAVRAFDSPGVFCVEMFMLADGRLLVNEVAPRPHNSGHYTLDACDVSQFEQQVRVVCGLPLGTTTMNGVASMVNLLGGDAAALTDDQSVAASVASANTRVHLYGKRVARPGRKMGHVTFVGPTLADVSAQADALIAALRSAEQSR